MGGRRTRCHTLLPEDGVRPPISTVRPRGACVYLSYVYAVLHVHGARITNAPHLLRAVVEASRTNHIHRLVVRVRYAVQCISDDPLVIPIRGNRQRTFFFFSIDSVWSILYKGISSVHHVCNIRSDNYYYNLYQYYYIFQVTSSGLVEFEKKNFFLCK